MFDRELEREPDLRMREALDPGGTDTYYADVQACFYCGCTEYAACDLSTSDRPFDPPQRCSWHVVKGDFAVCSAPACVQSYLADASAP